MILTPKSLRVYQSTSADKHPVLTQFQQRHSTQLKQLYGYLQASNREDYTDEIDSTVAYLRQAEIQVMQNENIQASLLDTLLKQKGLKV